jgi:hypothetical protein
LVVVFVVVVPGVEDVVVVVGDEEVEDAKMR